MDKTTEVIETVRAFLDNEELEYEIGEDNRSLRTRLMGTHGLLQIRVWFDVKLNLLALVVDLPLVVPENLRADVADAVNRANLGLALGRFVVDPTDGQLHFFVSVPLHDTTLAKRQWECLFVVSMQAADGYLRAFSRLVYAGDLSPAEVIGEVRLALDES